MGNRVLKTQIPRRLLRGKYSGYFWNYTTYMRDAQGNVMATYDMDLSSLSSGNIQEKYYLSEENIYGSSRVGMIKSNEYMAEREFEGSFSFDGLGFSESQASTEETNYDVDIVLFSFGQNNTDTRGNRYYELSNHLGNVLEVVTDRKIPEPDGSGNNIDYYYADVVSYSDYYPFGFLIDDRSGSTPEYRYGFQGQEKDDEVKGEGNSLDFGARIYDPRVARFLSIDPREKDFPFMSPYVYAANSPIRFTDKNGEGPEDRVKRLKKRQLKLSLKASNELLENNGIKTTKWHRIQRRLERVNTRLNGGNDGKNTPKKANFGRGHSNNGEGTTLGHTYEYVIESDDYDFNSIGYKAARINEDGELEVFQVGEVMDIVGVPPAPRWPKDNEYGQPEGSKVIVDDGNIVDPDGNVLIPLLDGMSQWDGLYQEGDVTSSGEEIKEDKVMRTEIELEKDATGKPAGSRKRRRNVTKEIEEKN